MMYNNFLTYFNKADSPPAFNKPLTSVSPSLHINTGLPAVMEIIHTLLLATLTTHHCPIGAIQQWNNLSVFVVVAMSTTYQFDTVSSKQVNVITCPLPIMRSHDIMWCHNYYCYTLSTLLSRAVRNLHSTKSLGKLSSFRTTCNLCFSCNNWASSLADIVGNITFAAVAS